MAILNNTKASLKRVVKHLYNISYNKEEVQEKVLHQEAKQLLDAVNYKYIYEKRCCYIGRSFIEPDFLLYDKNGKITPVEFKKRGVSLNDHKIFTQVTKYANRLYDNSYDMSGVAILTDGRFYHFYHIDRDGFKTYRPFKSFDINNPEQLVKLAEEFLMFAEVTDEISDDILEMVIESGAYLYNGSYMETEVSVRNRKCYIKFEQDNAKKFKVITAYYLPRFRAQFRLEDDQTYINAQMILDKRFN